MELVIRDLTKRYGEKLALDSFSYSFTPGIYGILGANGAGKTTLMNLITDNVKRDQGEILLDGKEILTLGAAYRALLGYMPQQQGMYPDFSAREFLLYMAELKGLPRKQAAEQIGELLRVTGLSDVAHKRLGGFSGGMKQRALLCQALLGDPKILILDEPSAGLDPKERLRIRQYIAELAQDRIVFLTTHIVSDIESIAKDVLLMKAGRVLTHGAPEELLRRYEAADLEEVYLKLLGDD
ncbi:MAG: ATP-binding cassette domain-containing protein [Lachnospiraceae bacterium]|nr:ATP-binding cassette domain-containing protein [Lachnospiraceae bacterium]